MEHIETALVAWKESLLAEIPIGGLYARSEVAHKWKAPFRSMMVREAACWRTQDLLVQSVFLYNAGHVLGARILLRSAFETFAILVYLNLLMDRVLDGNLNFHDFDEKTTQLLAGARNQNEGPSAINIMTVLEKCEQRYSGLLSIYNDLSESAHPNWEGLCWGYSKVDHDGLIVKFSNRWVDLHQAKHLSLVELCMMSFIHEYDDVWSKLFHKLEEWLQVNDEYLISVDGLPRTP